MFGHVPPSRPTLGLGDVIFPVLGRPVISYNLRSSQVACGLCQRSAYGSMQSIGPTLFRTCKIIVPLYLYMNNSTHATVITEYIYALLKTNAVFCLHVSNCSSLKSWFHDKIIFKKFKKMF